MSDDVLAMIPKIPSSGADLINGSGVAGTTIDDALDTLNAGKQPKDAMLTALAAISATSGLFALSAADTPVMRSLAVGSSKLTVTNANGVAGNPSYDLGSVAAADLTNGTNGSGAIVLTTSPALVTPSLGVASATSINKVAITAPATSATLTLADGSSLITSGGNSLTLTTTGATNVTLPTTGTLSTLSGSETLANKTLTAPIISTITNTGTLTLPTATTTLVGDNTTNVLTNKSIDAGQLTGTIAAGRMPALTGDVTTSAGAVATTIAPNVLTYSKFQQVAASSLVGNPTGSLANAQGITLGTSLQFSGTTLTTIQGIRTADTPQFTRLGLGTAATTSEGIKAFTSTSAGSGFENGTYGVNTFSSTCTTLGCGMQFAGATAAAAFTMATGVCMEAGDWALGAGSAITNLIGFDAAALTKGGTLNLGFRGQVTSGATGGFNCYMSGTAANYFAGDVRIGSSSAAYKLTVTATSNLARFQYDTSNRCDLTVTSTGDTTVAAVGTNASLNLQTTGTGGVQINGGAKLLKHLTATASLSGFGSIAANTSANQTITVTGAAVGDDVSVTPNGSIGTGLVFSGYVSATDTVTVIVANCTTGPLTPTTRTWRAVVRSF